MNTGRGRTYNATTYDEIIAYSKAVNLKPLFSYREYINQRQNLPYRCLNKHCEWLGPKKLEKIILGQGCPECSDLLYERLVRLAFQTLTEKKFPKYFPKDLINAEGNRMSLDGFSEESGQNQ